MSASDALLQFELPPSLDWGQPSDEVSTGLIDTVTYEKLFATPVFHYHIPAYEELNAALLEFGAALQAASPGVSKSNRGGWHSEGNLFKSEDDGVRILEALVREAVLTSTERAGARADLDALHLKISGWMNINPTLGYNAPHTHPGAHWSGVYYVKQPEIETGNSGMIEFLDPRSDLPNWRILDAPTFRLKKKLRPEAGDLILFPSYLVHWVYPNEAEDERISIAFNATFKEKRAA